MALTYIAVILAHGMVITVILPLAIMNTSGAGISKLAGKTPVFNKSGRAGTAQEGAHGIDTLSEFTAASVIHRALAFIDILTNLHSSIRKA